MAKLLNREALVIKPLSCRENKLCIVRDRIDPASYEPQLSAEAWNDVKRAASEIRDAKACQAARILAFGAHSIKNGLAPVLIRLMNGGWITHFATNGAGIIHDWEFAFQGQSGENVQRYTQEGQFGIWEETGRFLNLAIAVGAYQGTGYAESVGKMMSQNGLELPDAAELRDAIRQGAEPDASEEMLETAAAAADLLARYRQINANGFLTIQHPWREYSLAWASYQAGIPLTCHPMFGHDIIYTHPMNQGAAIGRTAQRDFLSYAHSVSTLEHGVYLSVGSAVMSPMIFEKSLSMARNLAAQQKKTLDDFTIHVVDLAVSDWDWKSQGEPPQDHPAYYLRFCKTFSRMGGRMSYTSADNRDWLVALLQELEKSA